MHNDRRIDAYNGRRERLFVLHLLKCIHTYAQRIEMHAFNSKREDSHVVEHTLCVAQAAARVLCSRRFHTPIFFLCCVGNFGACGEVEMGVTHTGSRSVNVRPCEVYIANHFRWTQERCARAHNSRKLLHKYYAHMIPSKISRISYSSAKSRNYSMTAKQYTYGFIAAGTEEAIGRLCDLIDHRARGWPVRSSQSLVLL